MFFKNSCDFQRLMTVDNLDGQLQPTFRNALQDECSTLPWYGPKDRTDLWQPVDQGYAAAVKVEESKQEMKEEGMDCDAMGSVEGAIKEKVNHYP